MKEFPKDDFYKISRSLERYHGVFYKLWEMGKPFFNDSIKTAAVSFDREGEFIRFDFNPDYWDSLDEYSREFVICHECLHVILNHAMRGKDTELKEVCNIAFDLVVNHLLVSGFGFARAQVNYSDVLCWVDTVFSPELIAKEKIVRNGTFEYYYNLIEKNAIKLGGLSLVDEHKNSGENGKNGEGNEGDEEIRGVMNEDWKNVLDAVGSELCNEEKKILNDLASSHCRGTGALGEWSKIDVEVVKKRKWETVIRKWSLQFRKDFKAQEQWVRLNRRLVFLENDLFLPSEMEEEDEEEDKILVWFFQDTSGSCSGYKE